MKKFLFNAVAAVVVLAMTIVLGIMWFAPQKLYAGEPKFGTMERKPTDVQKAEPLADKTDSKDVVVKKLSNQLYRVDVKATAEGLAAYEAELIAFSKDHPSVHPSAAPVNPKGNTGSNPYYWNVDEK